MSVSISAFFQLHMVASAPFHIFLYIFLPVLGMNILCKQLAANWLTRQLHTMSPNSSKEVLLYCTTKQAVRFQPPAGIDIVKTMFSRKKLMTHQFSKTIR